MVIFRQIAEKTRVNTYEISSYKSRLLVKILLRGIWLIFHYFENRDQIANKKARQAAVSAKPN
jgi:hypothetical protein